jgi:hypothetical protein
VRADGGPSGVRVVVDPVDLMRVATTLGDAAADGSAVAGKVDHASLPEMPASVAGVVRSGVDNVATLLDAQSPALQEGMKELRVRALWAEISARMELNQPLTDAQLQQFLLYMRDGAMVDYATPYQRARAGEYIGERYRDTYKQPEQLIELADILRGSGSDADFAGAFIEAFGAENMANVPRVIQAMEWGPILAGSTTDAFYDHELANDLMLDGYGLDRNPLELLSGFSMALASATYAGKLTRETERELAYDEDSWAVSQLLHGNHVFGAEFLRDIFHSGVVAEIGRRSVISAGGGADMTSYAPIGGRSGDGIPTDQVQLIMAALERNDAAVALALTDPVPEQFQIGLYLEGRDDPLEILYDQNRFWDDDGERLARMYESGQDFLRDSGNADLGGRDNIGRANELSLSLIDRTLNSDYEDLDRMTHVLARDLSAHHMDSLHISAGAADLEDADGGAPGWVDPEDGYRLNLNVEQMTDLFREISDVPEANEALLAGAAQYQERLIGGGAQAGQGFGWAREVGGFDAAVMAANDLENQEDFDASNERHRLVFSFLHNATSLIEHPGVGIPVGIGLDQLEHMTEGDIRDLIEKDGRAESAIMNQMHAAIVHGFEQNGELTNIPARLADDDGNLRPYSSLDDYDRAYFNRWASTNGDLDLVVREAFQNADQTRDNVFELLVR